MKTANLAIICESVAHSRPIFQIFLRKTRNAAGVLLQRKCWGYWTVSCYPRFHLRQIDRNISFAEYTGYSLAAARLNIATRCRSL